MSTYSHSPFITRSAQLAAQPRTGTGEIYRRRLSLPLLSSCSLCKPTCRGLSSSAPTNSGQMSCQSFGRRSLRLTSPLVALSIEMHLLNGTGRKSLSPSSFAQRLTSGACDPMDFASIAALPRSFER